MEIKRRTISPVELGYFNNVYRFNKGEKSIYSANTIQHEVKKFIHLPAYASTRILEAYNNGDKEAKLILETMWEWDCARAVKRTFEEFLIGEESGNCFSFINLGIQAIQDPEKIFNLSLGEVSQKDLYLGIISYTPYPIDQVQPVRKK